MEKPKEQNSSNNNSGLILFLLKTPSKSLINMMKFNSDNLNQTAIFKLINYNKMLENEFLDSKKTNDNKNDSPDGCLKEIFFCPKMGKENLFHNNFISNKIIFVEGIKAWKKYAKVKDNYSSILFDEIMKINIKDNFFPLKKNQIKSCLIY